MKIHEALAQLKEDGSNYIESYGVRAFIYLPDKEIKFETEYSLGWKRSLMYGLPLDNWQIVEVRDE